MYAPLSRVLIRAPLLPVRALPHAARALAAHPLGADAIALASPSLAAARPDAARARAVERYARRAAFRPTPSGLLAGVCVGTLGTSTEVATGTPAAWLAPSWARMAMAASHLLDDPEVQERAQLRVAPSVVRAASTVWWIGPGTPFGEWQRGMAARTLEGGAGRRRRNGHPGPSSERPPDPVTTRPTLPTTCCRPWFITACCRAICCLLWSGRRPASS